LAAGAEVEVEEQVEVEVGGYAEEVLYVCVLVLGDTEAGAGDTEAEAEAELPPPPPLLLPVSLLMNLSTASTCVPGGSSAAEKMDECGGGRPEGRQEVGMPRGVGGVHAEGSK
jgi:hypothetical protein